MSRSFGERWEAEHLTELLPGIVLQPRLGALIHAPLVRQGSCLLLEPLASGATGRESFQDATGFEAFINKFHVEDLLDDAAIADSEGLRVLVRQGTKAALELSERLKREGNYRVLLSLDPEFPAMTLRFFERREGEPWGDENLDAYRLEEVLVIDTEGRE